MKINKKLKENNIKIKNNFFTALCFSIRAFIEFREK